MQQPAPDRQVFVLTGLHPGQNHGQLIMREFNQEILLARVVKPQGKPAAGALLPVIVQADQLPDSTKARLHRRYDNKQLTSFVLDGLEIVGRIIQIDYYCEQATDGSADPVEILTFVLQLVA